MTVSNIPTQKNYELLVKSIESFKDCAIFTLDAEGNIQSWNDGAARIKGHEAHEIIGQHFSVFYPKEEVYQLIPQKGLMMANINGSYEDEGWRVRKDGERFWANVIISALKDEKGKVIAYSMMTRDLTEKKRLVELEESVRIREEFISVASHELRTPVTKILMNLQFLKKTAEGVNDKLLKSLDVCENSTKELITLMDNLIDVSRLRLGRMEIKRTKTNMTSVVLGILNRYKDAIRLAGNHVSFVHDGDIIGYWDQARIDQLFSNLISNAVKYAEGKPIKIELRKMEPETISFSIQDEGPGIPYHKQPAIFERFERAVDSRKISGLGLGLYVSKQIVDAHRGEISLESRPGKGATFLVTLPVKQIKN